MNFFSFFNEHIRDETPPVRLNTIFHVIKCLCHCEGQIRTSVSLTLVLILRYFPGGSDGKESACNEGLILGWGRSPGGGHGNPFQYYCLENSMDRGAWRATVHGVTKSQIKLSNFHSLSTLVTHPSLFVNVPELYDVCLVTVCVCVCVSE